MASPPTSANPLDASDVPVSTSEDAADATPAKRQGLMDRAILTFNAADMALRPFARATWRMPLAEGECASSRRRVVAQSKRSAGPIRARIRLSRRAGKPTDVPTLAAFKGRVGRRGACVERNM